MTGEETQDALERLRRALPLPEFRDRGAWDRIRRLRTEPRPVESCGPRRLRFIAATEEVTADGEVLRVAGLDTDYFMRDPRVLWDHDPRARIGRVVLLAKVLDVEIPRVEVTVEFARDSLATATYGAYLNGDLTDVSAAYLHVARHRPEQEEVRQFRLRAGSVIVDRADLSEVSCVRIGANPGARIVAG